MFSSVRNIIISAMMALLLIGSSVAAATGFEGWSFSDSKSSLDDAPSISSSSDSLSDVSGSDSSADDLSKSSSSSSGADSDNSSSSDSSTSDSSTTDSTSSSSDKSAVSSSDSVDDGTLGEPVTYKVAEVGTVTVAAGDNLLHVTGTTVADDMRAAGWSAVIERADAIEVEVSFRGPDRVDFKAEIEHGEVRIRVRDRRLEGSSSGSSNSGDSNSSGSDDSDSSNSGSGSSNSGRSDSEVTQSSPASTDTQTANGVGGSVIVKSTGTELSLGTATPNTGWSMDVRDSGPSRVDVRFEKGNSETHIRFEISGGTVTVKVEERT